MTEPAKRRNFFISYSAADLSWAEWIATSLEKEGYSLFLQAWDMQPGSNLVLEMTRAASEAERTLAVLSPSFLSGSFTGAEWAAAFVDDPSGQKRKLIPVRVEPCELPGLLRAIVYIDLVGKDEEEARQALLAGLRDSGRPQQQPRFPGPGPGKNLAAAVTAPAAAPFPPASAPSLAATRSAELRKLIAKKLVTDSDLDAFCIDYFPHIKRRFSNGMDRRQKESYLLEGTSPDELEARLHEYEV